MIKQNSTRLKAAAPALAALFFILMAQVAAAQSLSVLPVNVFLSPGEKATTLKVTNSGQSETVVQIRAYDWNEKDGTDQLVNTNELLLSPPIAKIPAGQSQIVRVVLRRSPLSEEATYRIVLDQMPPPAEAGVVHLVLRLSIPVFALPPVRCAPDVSFRIENEDGQSYLVATNTGKMHEAIRGMDLSDDNGRTIKVESQNLSYILPGATRRWRIVAQDASSRIVALRLRAEMNAGKIDKQVSTVAVH